LDSRHLLFFLGEIETELRSISKDALILNIGAGKSGVIEKRLSNKGLAFTCDRLDIVDCRIEAEYVGQCYRSSIENMHCIDSQKYDVVFANFVLEHVRELFRAIDEIHRILKLRGCFVTTLPNPIAPEILLSRITPLWFHKAVRRGDAWETYYSYRSIGGLCHAFEENGFETARMASWSNVSGYLSRSAIRYAGFMYDELVTWLSFPFLKNTYCIKFRKTCL